MKRKIVFLLILSLLIIMTACVNDSDSNSPTPTAPEGDNGEAAKIEEPEISYYDTLGERNFEGHTFTILDANDNPHIYIYNAPEEYYGDPINDALLDRNNLIKEKYNAEIKHVQITGDGGQTTFKNDVLAGDNTYDMIICRAISGLSTMSTDGILRNLAEMPHLSLESPWWSKLMYEAVKFENKVYYTLGDIVPSMYLSPSAIYFNKKLTQDFGITDDLYSLVFDGKWTIDVLSRLTKDMDVDIDGDGKRHFSHDFFGVVNQDGANTSNSFAASMGIKLAEVRNDGIIVDFKSDAVVSKMEILKNIYRKSSYSQQNDLYNVTFQEDRALFMVHFLEAAMTGLRNMESDYGILPLPKYDDNQASYVSNLNPWSAAFVGVSLNSDPDKTGFLMEALGYASYEIVRPNVYELTLKTKVARDSDSARAIDIIIETSYTDLNCIYNWGGSCDVLREFMWADKPLVSAFEAKEKTIQTTIENFINSMS